MTEGAFFQDLAILTTIACFASVLFSRLGWPKVLGYIFAGIVMGEHTWGGSFLQDPMSLKTLAQLGVIFLMFAMGLSFSAKEMRRIRSVAIPCAVVDTIVMIWLGYTVGTRCFGWSPVESIFLGVAICDSATTLLAKVIDEMGWSARPFAQCVLGASVFEDIICVGAIAVATGFAQGGQMSLKALSSSLGGLFVFFCAVFVFGLILVPRLLKSIARQRDDEVFIITVLTCCLFVSYCAYVFDFSLALGAFLVGILISGSDLRDRIQEIISPLKVLFSAMFFVSIGLLVDPMALLRHVPEILLVSSVVIVGKSLNNAFASLAAGVDVKTAVQNGLSLAQIGEFAFMVAILYAGIREDADTPMFQIAVGVSLLTTILNPFLVRISDRVGDFCQRRAPDRFRLGLEAYRAWLDKIGSNAGSPAYILLKNAAIRLGVCAILLVAVSTLCALLSRLDYTRFSVFFERHDKAIFFILSNVFAVSLLPIVLSAARAFGDEAAELICGDTDARWRANVLPLVRFGAVSLVIVLYLAELTMVNISTSPLDRMTEIILTAVIVVAALSGWSFLVRAARRATQRFTEALTAEERREGLVRTMTVTLPEGTVSRLTIAAASSVIGRTIGALGIRAKTGVTIVSVIREGMVVRNVGADWELQAGDVLVSLGDNRQVNALRELLA